MMESFDAFWDPARPAFAQERTWGRARTLALSALVGLGRRTVTGMLSASAQTGVDWSAEYRLFERDRFDFVWGQWFLQLPAALPVPSSIFDATS